MSVHKHSIASSKFNYLNESKIIMVGGGNAGKTSIVRMLTENQFDRKEKQTKGIRIVPWEIDVNLRKQGIVPVKLNIWEFGGQKILHDTHKLFFTDNTIYILVLDGVDDKQGEYWLFHRPAGHGSLHQSP